MFDKDKYITRGINTNIKMEIQLLIWSYIAELSKRKNFKLDYLQVFELSPYSEDAGTHNEKIIHRQEVGSYEETHLIKIDEPFTAKIYVIDDGKYSTMMLAEEY